jgi:hypothetical protein
MKHFTIPFALITALILKTTSAAYLTQLHDALISRSDSLGGECGSEVMPLDKELLELPSALNDLDSAPYTPVVIST